MKRFLPLVALSSLILMGCPGPHYPTPEAVTTYYYCENPFDSNSDTTGLAIYANLVLPPTEDNDSVQRDAERTAAEYIIRKYFDKKYKYGDDIDTCITKYCQKIKKQYDSFAKNNPENPDKLCWEHNCFVDFDYDTYGWEIMTFSFSYYDYRGGENAIERNEYLTFDSKTGKPLGENDIFKEIKENVGKESTNRAILTNLLRKELEKKCRHSSNLNIKDFNISNIKPNGNFQITPTSIIYHYVTGEIAPRILGPQMIEIDKSKLLEIVNPESPLYIFWFNSPEDNQDSTTETNQ